MSGVVELDARAVAASVAVVEAVRPGQEDLPTPCGDWTLGRLLAHMAGQHLGFAAAARGADGDLAVWADLPPGEDPARTYARAAAEVLAAFAEDGAAERTLLLPEVHPRLRFPAATAIGFHLLDYVVHAWDVAVTLAAAGGTGPGPGASAVVGPGPGLGLDDEVLGAALAVAERVPAGPARLAPGAAFGPVLELPPGAGLLERVLALSGRSPDWPK